MTTCICLSYTGPVLLGPTIQLTCNPSGVIINESTINLTTNCPYCITVPSGTTTITAFDPVTNCTEVIPVEPVTDTPCSSGMDVVFCIDYTGSMGDVINKIKEQISILSNTITILSNNNYRFALVIFDEYYQINPPIGSGLSYYNYPTYQSLPPSQKYINVNYSLSKGQAITSLELLSSNNQQSFNTQLSNLNFGLNPYITRLGPNGIPNGTTPYFNSAILDSKYQSDGKLIVVGFINLFSIPYICRITTNGLIDPSFIVSNGFNNSTETLDINSLGQIIVGGSFTTYQGIPRNKIALLNTNGSINFGFNPGTGFDGLPRVVKFDQNGNILVGGEFILYNTSSRNRIVRLLPDGTPDPSFIMGTGFDNPVYSIDLQSDGKIIVGGSFNSYNGSPISNVCRLNTDGTLDGSFSPSPNVQVNVVKVQPDDKILLGGYFSNCGFTPCNRIVRLNSDGTIDNPFVTNIGSGFDIFVTSIELQSTGKIVVGGLFNTFNTAPSTNICRLNANGTLDNSFGCTPQIGANNVVFSVAVDGSDNIAVGGFFSLLNLNCFPGLPLGFGVNGPEPSDMAIDRIVNYNIAGSFNPSNSKYIVLITDNPPSGNDDVYDGTDTLFVQNTLIPSCQANNVKVILVKPDLIVTGISILEQLATSTGGIVISTPFNNNFNINAIANGIATLC